MVRLISHTDLVVADLAIGKCWNRPSKGGSINLERIERVANKNKHASTIEHLIYTFEIDMSRACLQEWSRHRIASLSVKSSRYTLKELKTTPPTEEGIMRFLVRVNEFVDEANFNTLCRVREKLRQGMSNDKAKFMLPEAYRTSLMWTINARSLQNFLKLRTDRTALWEIRDIAKAVYRQLPEDHKFLFKDFVSE